MDNGLTIRRKNAFNAFRETAKFQSYDEIPVLLSEIDPQLHVSRNSVDQPFYLICEKDSVIALLGGRARVDFPQGAVRFFDLELGDFVYVPGGTPHRISVSETGIQFRYKARNPGLEAAAWYCRDCNAEIDRYVWHCESQVPQRGYQLACERHNTESARRKCQRCGTEGPLLDLSAFRWSAVADALLRED